MAPKERKDAYREGEWSIDYHNTVIPVHSVDFPLDERSAIYVKRID